jgi:hypothetical protein
MATSVTPPGPAGLTAEARRMVFKDKTKSLILVAADTTQDAFLTKRANHRIWVQRIIGYVTTDAAQSITFRDDAGTPLIIATITTSPGDETRWDFDFGSTGIPLGENTDLDVVLSAAGLAGNITIYAYQAPSSVFDTTTASAQ